MKCMSANDRIFRAFMGIAIIVVGMYFQTWWGAAGLMPLMVGAIGRCPNFGAATQKVYLDREGLAARADAEDSAGYRTE